MTCSETHEYAFAFLDDELDAPLSIELQRHLEHCPDCAREVEIERTIRKRLSARIDDLGAEAQPNDEALRRAVMAAACEKGFSHQRSHQRVREGILVPAAGALRRRALAVAGIAAGLLVASTVWFWPRSHDSADSPFSELVVADFQHVQDNGLAVQFASDDPERVAAWLRGKTGLAVVMPPVQPTVCRLAGARKCKIAGQPAAFAIYRINGTPASFVVTNAETFDLEQMERSDRGGQTHWVDRHKGYTVVACEREGLLYAAVSTLGEEELLCLVVRRPQGADAATDGRRDP
jgi:anti-sigma factor RsiW